MEDQDDESKSETQIKNLKSIAKVVYRNLRKNNRLAFKQLASEIIPSLSSRKNSEEIKNIRRRLYDAVNVMVAANVLEKEHHTYVFLKDKKIEQCEN